MAENNAGVLKNVQCCPRCWTESMGNTVLLEWDQRSGIYTCRGNRMHRFTADENGFLSSVK
ncbi:MAG: hypothetical protein NTY90_00350 [Candidatus Micrarchaeota archaeon]|nr:hypothetical protein [Candidatus Micrarchaeota archaeon]